MADEEMKYENTEEEEEEEKVIPIPPPSVEETKPLKKSKGLGIKKFFGFGKKAVDEAVKIVEDVVSKELKAIDDQCSVGCCPAPVEQGRHVERRELKREPPCCPYVCGDRYDYVNEDGTVLISKDHKFYCGAQITRAKLQSTKEIKKNGIKYENVFCDDQDGVRCAECKAYNKLNLPKTIPSKEYTDLSCGVVGTVTWVIEGVATLTAQAVTCQCLTCLPKFNCGADLEFFNEETDEVLTRGKSNYRKNKFFCNKEVESIETADSTIERLICTEFGTQCDECQQFNAVNLPPTRVKPGTCDLTFGCLDATREKCKDIKNYWVENSELLSSPAYLQFRAQKTLTCSQISMDEWDYEDVALPCPILDEVLQKARWAHFKAQLEINKLLDKDYLEKSKVNEDEFDYMEECLPFDKLDEVLAPVYEKLEVCDVPCQKAAVIVESVAVKTGKLVNFLSFKAKQTVMCSDVANDFNYEEESFPCECGYTATLIIEKINPMFYVNHIFRFLNWILCGLAEAEEMDEDGNVVQFNPDTQDIFVKEVEYERLVKVEDKKSGKVEYIKRIFTKTEFVPMRKKYVTRDPYPVIFDELLRKYSADDFEALRNDKRILLTMEQQAALKQKEEGEIDMGSAGRFAVNAKTLANIDFNDFEGSIDNLKGQLDSVSNAIGDPTTVLKAAGQTAVGMAKEELQNQADLAIAAAKKKATELVKQKAEDVKKKAEENETVKKLEAEGAMVKSTYLAKKAEAEKMQEKIAKKIKDAEIAALKKIGKKAPVVKEKPKKNWLMMTDKEKYTIDPDGFLEANPLLDELTKVFPMDCSIKMTDVLGQLRNASDFLPNKLIPSTIRSIGRLGAHVTPSAESVGRFTARQSMKKKTFYQGKKGQTKPVEALHFKALEAALFNRFQEATVLRRRPSCSAAMCLIEGCPNSTFSLLGLCEDHSAEDIVEKQVEQIEKLKGTNPPEKVVATSLEDIKAKSAKYQQGSKKNKELEDYLEMASLRHEVHRFNSTFHTTPQSQMLVDEARKLLHHSFDCISDDDISQLYAQFQILDIDKDGLITLDDLKKMVGFVDSNLAKHKKFEEKCQTWFGIKTFYPNIPMVMFDVPEPPFNPGCAGCCIKHPEPLNLKELRPEHVDIEVSFQHYCIAVLNFRKDCVEHGVLDNLEFPFWSLRDIMIYSAPRDLKGNLWKRGSSGLGWTKRNYDIHGTADKVTLNKFLKDDDELDANEIMDEINLREMVAVTFHPNADIPYGYDVPKKLVTFKLLMSDGKLHTLCAERKVAVRWVATLTWYTLAARLMLSWKVQFGDLSKNKITVADWANCGNVIFKLTTYLEIIATFERDLAKAYDMAESKGLKDEDTFMGVSQVSRYVAFTAQRIIRRLKKYYTTPRERLILVICGIDETALKSSMVAVQCGLRGWNQAKSAASTVDPMFTGFVLSGLVLAGGAYSAVEYFFKFRTAKQKVRYGTEVWEHTSRECAVCKDVFPTVRLQSTKARHHCFSCGHFVCHQCSTTEMYLDVTGKVRRVCDECITNGVPKKYVDPFDVKRSDMVQKVERKAEFDDKPRDNHGNIMSAADVEKAKLAMTVSMSQKKANSSLISDTVMNKVITFAAQNQSEDEDDEDEEE